ncbi:MAG: mycothiol synthase [Acidimicrobiales bacterium]
MKHEHGSAIATVVSEQVLELEASGTTQERSALLRRLVPAASEVWVDDPEPEIEEVLADLQFSASRDLYKLGRQLPVGEGFELDTRAFLPGKDDEAWLRVNNAAFAWHREQGGWTQADLDARMAEDWFDPKGFLLHERGGQLAGFCWTKIHRHEMPPVGEIYVIAADQAFHGVGLGRRLTLAGLDHIASQGIKQAILYVDADNAPAVRLYDTLGFERLVTRRLHLPTRSD